MSTNRLYILLLAFLALSRGIHAQDLEPRAYVWMPEHVTFFVTGFGYTYGGVITDPALPLDDVEASILAPLAGAGQTFRLFGQSAQVSAILPYAWAQVTGNVGGGAESVDRSGLADMRVRISWLFAGAPAATPAAIAQAKRRTILGASVTAVVPTGEYLVGKLINLGTSRWSLRPELAISQPLGKRWLIDAYAGVWLFTPNNRFYPGDAKRTQDPLGAFQLHVSYTIKPRLWAAFDATYYTGGTTTVNGIESNDLQANARYGGTFVFPIRKVQSIKLATSTGAIIRTGANFTTFSVGWQTMMYKPPKKANALPGQ